MHPCWLDGGWRARSIAGDFLTEHCGNRTEQVGLPTKASACLAPRSKLFGFQVLSAVLVNGDIEPLRVSRHDVAGNRVLMSNSQTAAIVGVPGERCKHRSVVAQAFEDLSDSSSPFAISKTFYETFGGKSWVTDVPFDLIDVISEVLRNPDALGGILVELLCRFLHHDRGGLTLSMDSSQNLRRRPAIECSQLPQSLELTRLSQCWSSVAMTQQRYQTCVCTLMVLL